MKNRTERIDDFLKYLASIAYYNPDLRIDDRLIYYELVRIGVDQNQRNTKLNVLFPYWIEKYKNSQNLKVENAESWKYFCQFNNCDEYTKRNEDAIKMYIPIKPENIQNCANMIFNYLERENIKHVSKIGTDVRVDDLVVRVYSKADAAKVQQFVYSNEVIRNSMIESNPFLANDGLIAYASDGSLSYNSEISNYITMYINSKKSNNELENVNYQNFKEYIKEVTNYFFNTEEGLKYYKSTNNKLNNEKKVLDAYEVSKLINISLKQNATVTDVIEHYDNLKNTNYKEADRMHLQNITQKSSNNPKEIVKEAIYTTAQKHGNDFAISALIQYFESGTAKGITRENDCREKFSSLNKVEIINAIEIEIGKRIDSRNDLVSYFNKTINNTINKEYIFNLACTSTLNKYDLKQLMEALRRAIERNDFSMFTNDNNARNLLKQNLTSLDIKNYTIKEALNYNSNIKDMNEIYNAFSDSLNPNKNINNKTQSL